MIRHEHIIEYKWGQEFTLKPLFDCHIGSTYCDEAALKAYLAECTDDTLIIGGGDMLDSIAVKDIGRYEKHGDATTSDAIIDEQIDKMYDILLPYKKNIIGLGSGNHESKFQKYHGTHPARRLCKRLEVVSLGLSWFVRLRFRENKARTRTLMVKGHHGYGGGSRTIGADLTKYSRDLMYYQADMFLFGHTHRCQSDKVNRLSWPASSLIAKPIYLYICGSYKKALSKTDEATHEETQGYPPNPIGGINIGVKPSADWLDIDSDV